MQRDRVVELRLGEPGLDGDGDGMQILRGIGNYVHDYRNLSP